MEIVNRWCIRALPWFLMLASGSMVLMAFEGHRIGLPEAPLWFVGMASAICIATMFYNAIRIARRQR